MMQMTKILRGWRLVSFLAISMSACGPGYGPAGVELVVRRPPPPRAEVIAVSPGQGYVWVAGHHAWQGGDYVWVGGSWQRPPEARFHNWQPGHWASARGRVVLGRGTLAVGYASWSSTIMLATASSIETGTAPSSSTAALKRLAWIVNWSHGAMTISSTTAL